MPPRRLPPDPQALPFAKNEGGPGFTKQGFTDWICQEITAARDARARHICDGGFIDTWHAMYEQQERPKAARPWPDAADLASYIPTEKVDALRARLVQIVFGGEPLCTVEGIGETNERVVKVEEFHQWKAEDERLQTYVAKAIHTGLIEGVGVLEVTERHGMKKSRGPFRAALKRDEYLRPILGDDFQPQPAMTESGMLEPWSGDESEPYVEVTRESVDYIGRGPQYRVLTLKDFLFLPGHAEDMSDVWGFARRIYMRLPDLQQRVKQGLYDADAVEAMGTDGEREPRAEHARQGIEIAAQQGPTAEKELWEVHLLADIDGDGIEEWCVVCVSLQHQVLLRAAFDSIEQVRYVPFTPFPRPRSVYGYSFVGTKLVTIADEHTALRNMKADRQALAGNAPILRESTSIWDPDDAMWGPNAVIDVRSVNEIKVLQVPDVPSSTYQSEQTILGAAERVTGLNDASVSGVTPDTKRTATEIAATSNASFVRVDEPAAYLQESLEDLYILRHLLWTRALENEESGIVPPERVMVGLQSRGLTLPTDGPFKFTASDLHGHFRFKPRGSSATADKLKLRQDFAEFVTNALPALMRTFPAQAQQIAMNSQAFYELLEQALRLYGFTNLQSVLKQPEAPNGQPLPGMLAEGLPGMFAALGAGNAPAGPPMALQSPPLT